MDTPVIISAAGRGTRMKQLTQDKPKHLIEVAGRPFLAYLIDNLLAAGLTQLYLVVGYHASATYEFIEHHSSPQPITVINQFERLGEERYGSLMPLLAAAPELAGREVMVVMGDNLYSSADVVRVASAKGSAVAGFVHEHPERYGVLAVAQGRLQQIIEKPVRPSSSLVNTGLYRFQPSVWQVASQVGVSERGEYELTQAINVLATREPIEVVQLQDYWLDFGRPEDIDRVASFIHTGRV